VTASAFEADLETALADATRARADLVSTVQCLTEADLDKVKRGGWPIHRVITHTIEHDYYMAMFVASARGERFTGSSDATCGGQSIDEVLCRMEAGRTALLSAVNGIAEDDFYTLKTIGLEEFSPLSAIENAATHDREHLEQVHSILAS